MSLISSVRETDDSTTWNSAKDASGSDSDVGLQVLRHAGNGQGTVLSVVWCTEGQGQ